MTLCFLGFLEMLSAWQKNVAGCVRPIASSLTCGTLRGRVSMKYYRENRGACNETLDIFGLDYGYADARYGGVR